MNRNAYTWKMLTLIGRRHVLSVGGSIQKIFPPTSNRILLKVCISILDRIHDKEGRSSLSTKGSYKHTLYVFLEFALLFVIGLMYAYLTVNYLYGSYLHWRI
ncbi:uncharacterized protein LOC132635520 isoform X1 [Lycium barbarum]|uniref:uncharacterized protein LOC132635520 isoform X1 n=1 Tax=Lycium barbarum TaxID=112863 RepID=UPI00293EA24A|nr:uncharacterized protein LOC132635520 isoform X1 [Lycium barbarum]XP_060207939.1 uncharacterized protein LOC132635520 isoform X1 [Lycium barbarum]